MNRKAILTAVLLTFALTLWGQGGLRAVVLDSSNTPPPEQENVIAQIIVCLPIAEKNDTLILLQCDGIRITMPVDKLDGHELTIVLHPNDDDGPITSKKTVDWYIRAKADYDEIGDSDSKQ